MCVVLLETSCPNTTSIKVIDKAFERRRDKSINSILIIVPIRSNFKLFCSVSLKEAYSLLVCIPDGGIGGGGVGSTSPSWPPGEFCASALAVGD